MKPRVLVVEDNPLSLELAEFLLQVAGFDVGRAVSALEVREQVKLFKPHLVLMDIQMPNVDGVTAVKQLKANPATHDVRVIAFTAYAMKGDEQRLLAAGFDGYLAKPIEPDRFPGQVRAFLPEQWHGGVDT